MASSVRRIAPRLGPVLAATCVLLVACTDSSADEQREGDCAARLSYDGAVFDPIGRAPQGSRTGRAGRAEVIGCDAEPVDEVAVRRLPPRGEPELLVVRRGAYRGYYLREGVAPSPVPVPPSPGSGS